MPHAEPQAMAQTVALSAVLAHDAECLGRALGGGGIDKALRQKVRGAVWQAWALLQPAGSEDEAALQGEPQQPMPPPDRAALLAQVRELEALRREVADPAGTGLRRLREVWIRKPMRESPRPIVAATITERTARHVARHFSARVAVDTTRLAWFEARCRDQDPTRVAKVRQPDDAHKNEKKEARESLELLVKRGPSRFS